MENANIKITRLIDLEKKARESRNHDELNFIITNETRKVVEYVNCFLLNRSITDQFQVQAISDIASVDRTAPTVTFIEKLIKLKGSEKDITPFDLDQVSQEIKLERPKNLPRHLCCIPLISPQHGLQGYLVLSKASLFQEDETELLNHLSKIYGHCYNSFLKTFSFKKYFDEKFRGKKSKRTLIIALIICLFPVQLKSTAPVEVIPKNPFVVTAPINGVVERIIVNNNSQVKKGDLLIRLEDEDLKSGYNVALQALKIAEKELLRSRQFSFTNNEEKARLNELSAQVDLKKIELKFAQEKLQNANIYAEKDGVAIVERKNEWQGRPVDVGEKIITIANPKEVEFLVWLPVKDSLVIKEKSSIKVFLDISPISSLSGELVRASYSPSLSPQDILSYRIIGNFEGKKPPRIGLRGTATVYGSYSIFAYYVLRRPITFVRQFIGI